MNLMLNSEMKFIFCVFAVLNTYIYQVQQKLLMFSSQKKNEIEWTWTPNKTETR